MPGGKGGGRRHYFTFIAQEKRKMPKACTTVTFFSMKKGILLLFPLEREREKKCKRKEKQGKQASIFIIVSIEAPGLGVP